METEFEATVENWSLNFTKSSGNNLLRNSVGYVKEDGNIEYWTQSGEVTTEQDLDLKSTISGSGFILDGLNAKLTQSFPTKRGNFYTFSMGYKMNEMNPELGIFISILDIFEDSVAGNFSHSIETIEYQDFQEVSITFEAISNFTKLSIENFAGKNIITDLMLVEGEQKKEWTSHHQELYTTNFLSDEKGFKVRQVINGVEIGYTEMTPQEFAGYYRDTKVFKMNKHVFEASNIKVKNQIALGEYRLISMENGLGIAPINKGRD